MKAATDAISTARNPVFTGLGGLTTEAQQALANLAIEVGGTLDTSLSLRGRSGLFSLQRQGQVTASLGEVNLRGDTLVFWFCDPLTSHPRFLERFGGQAKQIIVVDDHPSATAKIANRTVLCDQDSALRGIAELRKRLAIGVEASANQPPDLNHELADLAALLIQSRYAVSIVGSPIKDSRFDSLTDSLFALTRELNDHTRAVILALRTDGNCVSGENVLSWMTGAPFAVQQNAGRTVFTTAYSAPAQLLNGTTDLMLVGSTPTGIEPELGECLRATPTIWLVSDASSEQLAEQFEADLVFAISPPGIADLGSWCRLDDVCLPLRPWVTSDFPSGEAVLTELRARLTAQ